MRYDPEILDPAVTPFARCPHCKKLIELEIEADDTVFNERRCPHCGIFLGEEELVNTFIRNFTHTQACSSANRISAFDIAIFPYLAVNLLLLWMEFPLWIRILSLLPYHSPIVICLNWFREHYWYDHFSDPEYSAAVQDVKKSLSLWIAANVLSWILLFV